jgi:hypothetical protein
MNDDNNLDLLDLDDNATMDTLPDAVPFGAPRPKKPWLLLTVGLAVIVLATYIIIRAIGDEDTSSMEVDLDVPVMVDNGAGQAVPVDMNVMPPVQPVQVAPQPKPIPQPVPQPAAKPAPQPQPAPQPEAKAEPATRPAPQQTSLFGTAVEDIRQAISLGDRFLFQRELFAGNGELMQKTLDELNGLGSLSEAMEYVAETFDWDKESTAVQLFENVLKRRFA